jgi:HEAT repeat protein
LYVGSKLGDSAFRSRAVPYLASDSLEVRRMAWRCLGAYPHRESLPRLWQALENARGLELQQVLWALEAQGRAKDWSKLVPLLRDPHFYNRRKARDLLLLATDSSWNRLRAAMPPQAADGELLEWCLLALDAKGSAAFLRRHATRLPPEQRLWLERPSGIAGKSLIK